MPLHRRFPWTILLVPAATALVFAAFAGYVALSDALWVNRDAQFYTDYSGIHDYFAVAKFAIPLFFLWFGVVFLLETITQYTAWRVSLETPGARVPFTFLLPLLNAYLFAQFMQWLEKGNWPQAVLLYFTPLFVTELLVRVAFLAFGIWKNKKPAAFAAGPLVRSGFYGEGHTMKPGPKIFLLQDHFADKGAAIGIDLHEHDAAEAVVGAHHIAAVHEVRLADHAITVEPQGFADAHAVDKSAMVAHVAAQVLPVVAHVHAVMTQFHPVVADVPGIGRSAAQAGCGQHRQGRCRQKDFGAIHDRLLSNR